MDQSKKDAYSDAPEAVKGRFDHAPEVVTTHQPTGADGLQAVGQPASEGLQAVDARPYYSPLPAYSSPDYSASGDEKAYPGQRTFNEKTSHTSRFGGKNRRKWILGGSIAIILIIIAVAVGVGVGVSMSSSSGGDGGDSQAVAEGSAQTTSAPSASSESPSTTSSSTISSTSSAVTSGATGLAQFSCESRGTLTSAENVDYKQDCFTQYQNGGDDFYDHSETITNIGGTFTKYTFQDCIDTCDEYNMDRTSGDLPCKAVSYYANLTVPVSMYGGNCFLKTGRGVAYNGDPFDYTHAASAYWACLDETTCIQ